MRPGVLVNDSSMEGQNRSFRSTVPKIYYKKRPFSCLGNRNRPLQHNLQAETRFRNSKQPSSGFTTTRLKLEIPFYNVPDAGWTGRFVSALLQGCCPAPRRSGPAPPRAAPILRFGLRQFGHLALRNQALCRAQEPIRIPRRSLAARPPSRLVQGRPALRHPARDRLVQGRPALRHPARDRLAQGRPAQGRPAWDCPALHYSSRAILPCIGPWGALRFTPLVLRRCGSRIGRTSPQCSALTYNQCAPLLLCRRCLL